MGVDAMIFVKPATPVSDDELRSLSWRLCVATGFKQRANSPALHRSEYHGGWIEFSTLWRLYSDHYERGSWPDIYAAIRWLWLNFPGGEVRYFGDHTDLEDAMAFTPEDADKLWKHWASENGDDYHARERGCACCGRPIYVNGGGGGERWGSCPACGKEFETKCGEWRIRTTVRPVI
jgi:hypothetical protein